MISENMDCDENISENELKIQMIKKILTESKNRIEEYHKIFNEVTNTTPEKRSELLIEYLKSKK